MILNLDTLFKPRSGDELQFQHFTFSGGEPHIKIFSESEKIGGVVVTHRIKSFNDLGLLCLAADALRRMGAELEELIIPYFPSARQDRVMVKGEALSVKIYSDIINSLHFKRVLIFDVHSEVTAALLEECVAISNHKFIERVVKELGGDLYLVSPDGGALKKIYKVSEALGGIAVVECSKSRDVKTGELTGFKVYNEDLRGKDCLIVDDICDGGGTFTGLAAELKRKNAGRLYLAVSHGIFSKGFDSLRCFEKIFSTDSFQNIESDILTQYKLRDGLLS